jgi:hypothetical protein
LTKKTTENDLLSPNLRQGAYVGAFIGLISGIIEISIILIGSPLIKLAVTEYLTQQSPSALSLLPALWNRVLANSIVIVLIVATIAGGVAGVLFVAFMKRIPGRSTIRKSVFFSFSLLALSLLTAIPRYVDPKTISSITAASVALALIEYPLLGCLFGYLLNRRLKPR